MSSKSLLKSESSSSSEKENEEIPAAKIRSLKTDKANREIDDIKLRDNVENKYKFSEEDISKFSEKVKEDFAF